MTLIPLLFSTFKKSSAASSCLGFCLSSEPILHAASSGLSLLQQSVSWTEGTEVCWDSRGGRGTLACSSDPWRFLPMRIQSASADGLGWRQEDCQSWEAASTQGLELYQV